VQKHLDELFKQVVNSFFSDPEMEDTNKVNYLVLCEYYKVPNDKRTYKCKHFKKLRKKFKKEIDKESK